MLDPLTPATPPGSPVAVATTSGSTSLGHLAGAIVEEQDPIGRLSVTFFALSSISSAVVWGIAVGVIPMEYHGHFAPMIRTMGRAFFLVSMGCGFLSEKRLPRWFAMYFTAIAVLWYGWDRTGLPGSIYPWNVATHTVLGLIAAVPSLLAHWYRRLTKGTA